MNRNAWIATLVLGCSLGAYAHEQTPIAEAPVPAIPYASTEAALEALRAKPGVTERSENDWFVVNDTADHVFWSITMPDNVMHPSIVRRALVEKDGAINVEMSIKCGVSKVASDDLARTFQEINDRLRERMERRAQPITPRSPVRLVSLRVRFWPKADIRGQQFSSPRKTFKGPH